MYSVENHSENHQKSTGSYYIPIVYITTISEPS